MAECGPPPAYSEYAPPVVNVPPAAPPVVMVSPSAPPEVNVPPAAPVGVNVPPAAPPVVNVPPPAPSAVNVPPPGPFSVGYYPNEPQPILMVQQPQSPPDYNYKPNDYLILSVVMTVACAVFSPLVLVLTIPAVMCSLMSKQSLKMSEITKARNQGLIAAYMNFFAVITAFVMAAVITGLVIGLYGPTYYRN